MAGDLPHHVDGDRPDRRARQPSGARPQLGPPGLDVDGEADQGIDQRQRIGPGLLRRTRDRHDVGHVRGEFDKQGARAHGADRGHHFPGQLRIHAEDEAAIHVGAGHVEFNRRYPLLPAQPLRERDKLADGLARDADDQRDA